MKLSIYPVAGAYIAKVEIAGVRTYLSADSHYEAFRAASFYLFRNYNIFC